jgi:transcriptional regulator of acetoin/glycerol metabolism
VRELKALAEQVLSVHGAGGVVHRRHLRELARWPTMRDSSIPKPDIDSARILEALERADGNVRRAAEELGLSRVKFHRFMAKANDIEAIKQRIERLEVRTRARASV